MLPPGAGHRTCDRPTGTSVLAVPNPRRPRRGAALDRAAAGAAHAAVNRDVDALLVHLAVLGLGGRAGASFGEGAEASQRFGVAAGQ